jgi:hypothetical protein
MVFLLGLSFLFSIYGTFYIAFAFREPPEALRRFFKVEVPLLFGLVLALLPDHLAIKVGRIGLGVLLLIGAAFFFASFLRVLLGALTAWI